MTEKKEPMVTIDDLPITFQVKYLGCEPAKGLWGIKHTRKPVDNLVSKAKQLPPTKALPFVTLTVTLQGLTFKPFGNKRTQQLSPIAFPVESVSYGVQDLVYTRVFSMIVVRDENLRDGIPFVCHAFVCESRNQARQITYALAAAFQEYGRKVKEEHANDPAAATRKFAIDLRSPEELENASDGETEA